MKTYPLFKVHTPPNADLMLMQVLNSGYINEGVEVNQLTKALEDTLKADKLVLTNSCTSALTLALRLAGVGPGDDVVSTPMTCVATNTPIVSLGANIKWADIDIRSGMLDFQSVLRAITPKTKAVMAVAWAGTPPEMEHLLDVCHHKRVKLILDAAHAFSAEWEDHPVHEWAHYTCYSFQAIKHFTTGDGGAIVCSNSEDYSRAKALKWFGLDRDRAKDEKGEWKGQQWDTDIEEAGYKFNMNNLTAALGLAQIGHIQNILDKHRANAALYNELFSDFPCVLPNVGPRQAVSSHWVYGMRVFPAKCKLTRDELLTALNAEGIMAGVVHVPNDTYTCFQDFKTDLPGVRQFSSVQFNLPCGWWLVEADIRHIAQRVKELTQ